MSGWQIALIVAAVLLFGLVLLPAFNRWQVRAHACGSANSTDYEASQGGCITFAMYPAASRAFSTM